MLLDLHTGFSGGIKWSGIPIPLRIFQFAVIHTVKGFGTVCEAEVDFFFFFLEFCCFFYDPPDVGNLISGLSCGSVGKESTHNAADMGLIPGWEDSMEKGKATHSSILA